MGSTPECQVRGRNGVGVVVVGGGDVVDVVAVVDLVEVVVGILK